MVKKGTLLLCFFCVIILTLCSCQTSTVSNIDNNPEVIDTEISTPEQSDSLISTTKSPVELPENEPDNKDYKQTADTEETPLIVEEKADAQNNPPTSELPEYLQDLEAHYIDVGQADCILIKLPNGSVMLIDGGNRSDSKLILNYLAENMIETIDYLIATHPHEDHIGGLPDIIEALNINSIYMPKASSNTQIFEELLIAIQNKEYSINTAKSGVNILSLPELHIDIIAPVKSDYKNINDYSAVINLTYKNTTFLFTGDAETVSESQITSDVKADVLKVGHHGSDTSSSDAFLNKVNPQYAIISVGKDNSYGHPNESTLAKLNNANINVFRTDKEGTIIVTSDGEEIKVNKEPTPYSPNAPPAIVAESTPSPTVAPSSTPTPAISEPQTAEVYVTKTGAKYHSNGCRYLSKSKIPISLENAKKKYDPCSVCNPPR